MMITTLSTRRRTYTSKGNVADEESIDPETETRATVVVTVRAMYGIAMSR